MRSYLTKYPRTFHLPYSQNRGDDDKVLPADDEFLGKRVVVTEKMDGENTSIYKGTLHARSVDSAPDESRRWLDRLRLSIAADIPTGWRICGENLFFRHTVPYNDLETLFYVYSIWNEKNECLSWQETLDWCALWDLKTIPVMYEGLYDKQLILQAWSVYVEGAGRPVEGFVVRLADGFLFEQFKHAVAKFVAQSFQITTSKHWRYDVKYYNQLKDQRNVWEIIR